MKSIISFTCAILLTTIGANAQNLPVDFSAIPPVPLPNPETYPYPIEENIEELKMLSARQGMDEIEETPVSSISSPFDPNTNHVRGFNPFPSSATSDETDLTRAFSNLEPADLISGFPNYPFSAVVKISMEMKDEWGNITGTGSCSGIMVGPRHVMTAGHCIAGHSPKTSLNFGPNSFVVPAYNMGNVPYGFAYISEWHSFNGWVNSADWNYDIALLVLDHDIGNQVGWLGRAYTENSDWFTNSGVTKFSVGYPGSDDFGNPVFEGGERMYAMQGFFDWVESFNSVCHNNIGFHGQSGSGLYYKETESDRYVVGVLSHGNGTYAPYYTCHTHMDQNIFDSFNNTIANTNVSTVELDDEAMVQTIPNPTSGQLMVSFSTNESAFSQMSLMDIQGKTLYSEQLSGGSTHLLDISKFTPGIYYLHFKGQEKTIVKKVVKY